MSATRIVPRGSRTDVSVGGTATEVHVRARGDSTRRGAHLLSKVAQRLWRYTQVDYQGSYSLEKTLCLLQCRQSKTTQAALLLLSPWLSLVCSLLSELLPLEDPRLGWRRCPNFQLRLLFRTTIFSAGNAVIAQETVPAMYLSPLRMLGVSVFQALSFQGGIVLCAEVFHVFPVPFSLFAATILYVPAFWLSRLGLVRKIFRRTDRAATEPIRKRFLELIRLANSGPVILLVYAAFATAFYRVGSRVQFVLALLLQVLKVAAKYNVWSDSYFSPQGDDLAGQHVTGGTHFFHALFTVTSLQASKSPVTLLALVGWNVIFDVYSMHKLFTKSAVVDARWQSLPLQERRKGRVYVVEKALTSLTSKSDQPGPGFPVASTYERIHLQAQSLLCQSQPVVPPPGGAMTGAELAWLRETTQYFHWRETVLLRLFVDIFVPCFYFIFVTSLQNLPNGKYFSFLQAAHLMELAQRVLVHVCCKSTILTAFLLIQKRQKGQRQQVDGPESEPSELQHLCYVLYAHRYSFQATLLIVGLAVLDFPLAHLGNDLTFHFTWLRERQPVT